MFDAARCRLPGVVEPSRSKTRKTLVWSVLGGCATVMSLGCAEPPTATLVGFVGCALEGEEFDFLEIKVRGDFSTAVETIDLLRDGDGTRVGELADEAAGITVEGKVGNEVVAVGRTARLRSDGALPVYFAPQDQWCAVPSGASSPDVGAIAVGERGDVLILGGRTEQGALVDDILHYRDLDGVATPVADRLPSGTTGLTLNTFGSGMMLAVGGATAQSQALTTVTAIEVAGGPQSVSVAPPTQISVPGRVEPGRAYHASVAMSDGSVLVTGGCSIIEDGACVPSLLSVNQSSFMVSEGAAELVFTAAPSLTTPRYDHDALVAADDAVFVVAGRGVDGERLDTIEVLYPESGVFVPYGPLLSHLGEGVEIIGATLMAGGVVVVAASDGTMSWVNEREAGYLEGWCRSDPGQEDSEEPPCFVGQTPRRPMMVLPGERVVADGFIFPVAFIGQDAADVVDLAAIQTDQTGPPPPQRTGAATVVLDDGTVLYAGGRDASTGAAVQPFLARLRPRLDGPDEELPNLANLEPGSFVLHDPLRIDAVDGKLVFTPAEDIRLPSVWAHVRGFRSSSFRLEVTLLASGDAEPSVVFASGALRRTVLKFTADGVRALIQDATPIEPLEIDCGLGEPPSFGGFGLALKIDANTNGIAIEANGETIARCPSLPAHAPVAVGLGASNVGTVWASRIRLARTQ